MSPDAASTSRGDSPIFVVGVAHSGTTILHRMLAYHPALAWFSQFSLRGGEIRGRSRIPGARLVDRRLRSIPHHWQKQKPSFRRPPLTPRPGEAWTIWADLINDGRGFASVEELDESTPGSGGPRSVNATIDGDRLRSCLAAFSEQFEGHECWPSSPSRLLPLSRAGPDGPARRPVRAHSPRWARPFPSACGRSSNEGWMLAARFSPRPATGSLRLIESMRLARPTCSRCATRISVRTCTGSSGRFSTAPPSTRRRFPSSDARHGSAQTNSRWVDQATPRELEEVSEIQREQLNRFGYPLVLAAAGSFS